jgi:V8-like Glu-specific endopeptidase
MRTDRLVPLFLAGLVGSASDAPAQQTKVTGAVTGVFSNVCHLHSRRSTWRGQTWNNGSAILYRGRYLITAAHNVYSIPSSKVMSVIAACGQSEAPEAAHFTIDLSQVRVAAGYRWVPRKRFSRDFAVIRLSAPLPGETAVELFPGDLSPDPLPIELAGFPGREDERDGMNGWRMFKGKGIATPERGKPFLNYDFDSEKGNSGGPVWTMAGTVPVLVGIHVRGSGARIVDQFFRDEVNRMIGELERRPAPEPN